MPIGFSNDIIKIFRIDGRSYSDVRPLVRLNVQVVVSDGKKQETQFE